jgi:steroid delta-isomerase
MLHPAHVQRLIDYWQTLTPARVADIATIYTEDAHFRDPFNDVVGLDAIRHIFADMFVRLHDPRFVVIETIASESGVMLIWDFHFRIKSLQPGKARRIHGATLVRFAADGRVHDHRDYWDAAGELYEQLPVIGWLMRVLKRMAA